MRPTRHQAGATSLVVVMVLFFLVALVAAYTSRNLIFEQRTSVNQLRAMQVFEVAQAGLDWSIAMLNGGRIGGDCTEATAVASDTSFRQRYLQVNVNPAAATAGAISAKLQSDGITALRPTCVWGGTAWTCNCPSTSAPSLSAPSGSAQYPAFRMKITSNNINSSGVVRIEVTACTKLVDSCLDAATAAIDQEGRAQMTALVALAPSIPVTPGAALTARGNVTVPAFAALTVSGGDQGGKAIRTSGSLAKGSSAGTLAVLPAGAPWNALVSSNDGSLPLPTITLASTDPPIADLGFGMTMGTPPATYKWQPAALRIDCPAGGCLATLTTAAAMNPDRVIWINGNLKLESAGDVGAADSPVTLVVEGDLDLAANSRIFGFIYTRGANLAGSGSVQGAVFFEGNLSLSSAAAPTITLDTAILAQQQFRAGSYVRLPGGWKDFP